MTATNKRRQPAGYSAEGLGLSMELGLEQGLHVVAAIIPVIAYVPHGWPDLTLLGLCQCPVL